MAKTTNGTKRGCPKCSAKFYDLGASSVVCPKCGYEFPSSDAQPKKRAAIATKAAPARVVKDKKKFVVDGVELEGFDEEPGAESLSDLETVTEIEDLEDMDDFESVDNLEEVEDHNEDTDSDRDSDDGDDEAFIENLSADTAFLDQIDDFDGESSRHHA